MSAKAGETVELVPQRHGGALRFWKPGESGNPGGKGGELRRAHQLARESTVKAVQTLIALLDSDDDRVRAVAANSLWDKAGGKVMENNPEKDTGSKLDLSKLTLPELQFLLKLVRSGAMQMTEALPVPLGGEATEGEANQRR